MNNGFNKTGFKFFYRAITPILLIFLIFIYIIFFSIIPSFRNIMIEQKKYFLVNTVQASWHIIEKQYSKFLNGDISEKEAKEDVIRTFETIRYGSELKDYFWIINTDPVLLAHPYRKDLINLNVNEYDDPAVKKLFRDMIDATEKTGENCISYNWQLYDNPEKILPKMAHLKRFKPWNWIIGTGIYIDDIDRELKDTTGNILVILVISTIAVIILSSFSALQTFKVNKGLLSEEIKLEGIFNNSTHFISLLNTDGTIIKANRTSIDYFNLSTNQIENIKIWELFSSFDDHKTDFLKESIIKSSSGEIINYKTDLNRDGVIIHLDIFIKPVFIYNMAIKYLIFEGIDITDLVNTHNELIELNSKLEKIVTKRTEKLEKSLKNLKKAQEELVESEKLAALGNLVAGVAHEINTPMGITYTNITFINEKLHELQDHFNDNTLSKSFFENNLKTIIEALSGAIYNIERSSKLIKSFKNVAVDQIIEEKRRFNIIDYLNEVVLSIRPLFKNTDYSLVFNPEGNIIIESYPGIFLQIINNLVNNSLQHAFEGRDDGKVVISVSDTENEVLLNFSDNGIGISKKNLKKIFEPFFTTKRGTGGAGLGMNIVYNLVTKSLGGTITCKSSPENGTTFNIIFPKNGDRDGSKQQG